MALADGTEARRERNRLDEAYIALRVTLLIEPRRASSSWLTNSDTDTQATRAPL
jgi:hypothetical protein